MKFVIENEHKNYFEENKGIEFENVLLSETVDALKENIASVIKKRLSGGSLNSPRYLFEAGRDLWQVSQPIKKFACERRLGELAYQLTEEKPLRLGYDQYYPSLLPMDTAVTLKEMSSLSGVVCGFLFALGDSKARDYPFFPLKKTNVVILHEKALIDWTQLAKSSIDYYLVVYVSAKCVYLKNSQDPFNSHWREMGYSIGDRLVDEKNPIVFR